MSTRSDNEGINLKLEEMVFAALDRLQVELPFWGFANAGTR
ncbi:MAG: hypothetical protein ABI824_11265 [Acidobacteriota bacterium]